MYEKYSLLNILSEGDAWKKMFKKKKVKLLCCLKMICLNFNKFFNICSWPALKNNWEKFTASEKTSWVNSRSIKLLLYYTEDEYQPSSWTHCQSITRSTIYRQLKLNIYFIINTWLFWKKNNQETWDSSSHKSRKQYSVDKSPIQSSKGLAYSVSFYKVKLFVSVLWWHSCVRVVMFFKWCFILK